MRSLLYRAGLRLFDFQGFIRFIKGQGHPDVAFITNFRDNVDRGRHRGKNPPPSGHVNAERLWMSGVAGRIRAIDTTVPELMTPEGQKRAQEQFLSAVQWASDRGSSVVTLAAGTKRLFGRDGAILKEKFPNLLFTVGDNGTAHLLVQEVLAALNRSSINPDSSRIVVLGPYGLLGEVVTGALISGGYNVIGVGPNEKQLERINRTYCIDICSNFRDMGVVDAIIACTHSSKVRLTAEILDAIRQKEKKVLLVDVAEPANLSESEYAKSINKVIRIDAGNAYSRNIKYVLGPIGYKTARLSRGVTWGCFAESLALAYALRNGSSEKIRNRDWFSIDENNMILVKELFEDCQITVPGPRCFGKPVRSFDLSL
jgi:predicted amino acid dehydrogenase